MRADYERIRDEVLAGERRYARRSFVRAVQAVHRNSGAVLRCIEWAPSHCSGEMTVKQHDKGCPLWFGQACDCRVKEAVWVAAHALPIFAQCSGCGHAPLPDHQGIVLGRILVEERLRAARKAARRAAKKAVRPKRKR